MLLPELLLLKGVVIVVAAAVSLSVSMMQQLTLTQSLSLSLSASCLSLSLSQLSSFYPLSLGVNTLPCGVTILFACISSGRQVNACTTA